MPNVAIILRRYFLQKYRDTNVSSCDQSFKVFLAVIV